MLEVYTNRKNSEIHVRSFFSQTGLPCLISIWGHVPNFIVTCYVIVSLLVTLGCLLFTEVKWGGRGLVLGERGGWRERQTALVGMEHMREKEKEKFIINCFYQGLTTDPSDGSALTGKFFAQSSFICDCHPVTRDCYTECKDFEHLCSLWQWSLIAIVAPSCCVFSSHVHAHKGGRFSNRCEHLWTMRWLHCHCMQIICRSTHGCLYCYASSHSLSASLCWNAANTVGSLRIISNYVPSLRHFNNTRLMSVLHCHLHLDKKPLLFHNLY